MSVRNVSWRTWAPLGLVVVLSGCAAEVGASDATLVGGISLPNSVPHAQQFAFVDDAVTRAEYETAFEGFTDCLAESEIFLSNVSIDQESGLVLYAVPNESPGQDPIGTVDDPVLSTKAGRCFNDTFSWIELAFQVGDPVVRSIDERAALASFDSNVRPCLIANSVDVPSPLPAVSSEEFGALLAAADELKSRGSC